MKNFFLSSTGGKSCINFLQEWEDKGKKGPNKSNDVISFVVNERKSYIYKVEAILLPLQNFSFVG